MISKIGLIHIIDHDKLNLVGKDKYALSKKWFYDNKNQNLLEKLGKHTTNYFHNICKAKSEDCLWTTYDEIKSLINGKCFRKGFISLNNKYITDRKYLAFLCNLFYPTNENIEGIEETNYALSEMLQFIWRSAIRDGKEIWIYIPSIRMRNLLKKMD